MRVCKRRRSGHLFRHRYWVGFGCLTLGLVLGCGGGGGGGGSTTQEATASGPFGQNPTEDSSVSPPAQQSREEHSCCRLPDTCLSLGRTDCESTGGVFSELGNCDELDVCNVSSPLLPGCCQFAAGPEFFCDSTISDEHCALDEGLFFLGAMCDFGSGLCGGPLCGNGVLEAFEECERGIGCGDDRACNRDCQCTGAFQVTLRWSNHNDVNLRVIDPDGVVLLPFVDANANCYATTRKPEETVFLAPGEGIIGCYRVLAAYERRCPESGIVDTHLDIRTEIEGVKGTIHDVPGPDPGELFVTFVGLRTDCRRGPGF